MNGEQIRAARALAGMTAQELADASGVSYPTVQRLDATRGPVSGRHDTVAALIRALEARGVQFLEEGQVSSGAGVALKAS
ncbi:helix-turn-helix domain-containing protein [Paracoccus niistensis]|uniref:Helix-turn-helix domain-containing protein n=1 Tax=Paracoccus niistensis TaxID=632935 RepID=A0ABV6I0N0_9RHOB